LAVACIIGKAILKERTGTGTESQAPHRCINRQRRALPTLTTAAAVEVNVYGYTMQEEEEEEEDERR